MHHQKNKQVNKIHQKMITIKGEIGANKESNLLTLIEQISKVENNNVHVLIDSIGGDMDEGISMYQYLKNTGKTITTECINNCASIASILFLVGEKRIAGCPILIHNPYLASVSGDSKALQEMSDYVLHKEQDLQAIYMQHTTLDKDTLSQLMDRETYISPSQAVNLGFATEAKAIAIAKINKVNNHIQSLNKTTKMNKDKQTVKDVIRSIFGVKPKTNNANKVYNMTLTTENGETLQVDKENGTPEVGDLASPNGTFIMPDGYVITVEDGTITNINTPQDTEISTEIEEAVIETVEEMQSIIQELKDELATSKEKLASTEQLLQQAKSAKVEDTKVLNAVRMAGGADVVFAKFGSVWKPQARQATAGNQVSNALRDRINAMKSMK